MLGKGLKYYSSLIKSQKRPIRFLMGQFLRQTGLCRCFTVQKKYYKIRFQPTAHSMNLWVNKNDFDDDEKFLASYLRDGDTMVDIGANIGVMTMTAARLVGDSGKVFAVEAHPGTFNCLKKNISYNRFANVTLFNFAVGHEKGVLSFSDKRADDTNAVVEHSELEIPVTTLDALILPQVDKVDLLKIDVEGYERFVCQGAAELLKITECIYIEAFDSNFRNYGYHTSDLIQLFNSAGFVVVRRRGEVAELVPDDYSSHVCENLIAVRDVATLSSRMGWKTEFTYKSTR